MPVALSRYFLKKPMKVMAGAMAKNVRPLSAAAATVSAPPWLCPSAKSLARKLPAPMACRRPAGRK